MDRLEEAILIKSIDLIQGHLKENPKDLKLLF